MGRDGKGWDGMKRDGMEEHKRRKKRTEYKGRGERETHIKREMNKRK